MARILVTGDSNGIAAQTMLENLVEHIKQNGHDAALVQVVDDPAKQIRDADAVVAILDSFGSVDAGTLVAFAHAERKPVLGVFRLGATPPRFLRAMCTQVADVRRGAEIRDALNKFYDHVKPFAGRVVRDGVPELVRAAGHEVKFRKVDAKDLPRFMKRKIAEEAAALDASNGGQEKEELADLLEALEAFISIRGIDRDELKRIKAHKKEQRGGFTEGYVVESATTTEATPAAAKQTLPSPADHEAPSEPAGAPPAPEPAPTAASSPSRGLGLLGRKKRAERAATPKLTIPDSQSGGPAGTSKKMAAGAPAARTPSAAPSATPAQPEAPEEPYEGPEWEAPDAVPVKDAVAKPTEKSHDESPGKESEARVWDL